MSDILKPEMSLDERQNEYRISDTAAYIAAVYGVHLTPTKDECAQELARLETLKSSIHGGMPSAQKQLLEIGKEAGCYDGMIRLLDARDAYIDRLELPTFSVYEKRSPMTFRFPNDHRRSRVCIEKAFKQHGMEVADIHWAGICWTYVLTTNGDLWLHDTSHGGGGQFSLDSRAK